MHDAIIFAQGTSSNYRIDESFIGPGGNLESNSSGFQLEAGQQSVGNTSIVNSVSNAYRSQGGFTTTSDPRLICGVDQVSVDFGSLSPGLTATATATFRVLNYTAHGYNVNIIGSPLTMDTHTITGMNPNAGSSIGTEQFGINLVANTSPTSFGASPLQIPDNTFSSGEVATNYNTSNSYRYVSGETIASANESSGETEFTISYIVNVSSQTPGGRYTTHQVILCTGFY